MLDLETLEARRRELERQLASPEVLSDPRRCAALGREFGAVQKLLGHVREIDRLRGQKREAQQLLETESDPELCDLAREDLADLDRRLAGAERDLEDLLLEKDEAGDADLHRRRVILEVRAGTGGEEASLFAADLVRMYQKFGERRRWRSELLQGQATDLGGFREAVLAIEGEGAYRCLRFESGGHRVQRVPKTEAQGRIHTSAATVAVMAEPEEVELVLKPEELRIDTMRAGGPGGQKVNKTESAVRIIHLPTGIQVHCQDEKSQHKNRDRAMRILRSRLLDHFRSEAKESRDRFRREQIGSGDRSQRVRTYNFPQSRVTDHRIGESFHNLEEILLGDLEALIGALERHDRERRLGALRREPLGGTPDGG